MSNSQLNSPPVDSPAGLQDGGIPAERQLPQGNVWGCASPATRSGLSRPHTRPAAILRDEDYAGIDHGAVHGFDHVYHSGASACRRNACHIVRILGNGRSAHEKARQLFAPGARRLILIFPKSHALAAMSTAAGCPHMRSKEEMSVLFFFRRHEDLLWHTGLWPIKFL